MSQSLTHLSDTDLSYQDLISNPEQAKALIEGSYLSADHPVVAWERARRFIAGSINHDGTVLDIGCANGFLLKSVQSWSEYELEPYGIDAKQNDIDQAKKLFPKLSDHFYPYPLHGFLEQYPSGFPEQFDFIYWAVWVEYEITKEIIDLLLNHTHDNGKLILGFYPDDSKEPSDVHNNIGKLEDLGFEFDLVKNDLYPNRNEKLVIIRKEKNLTT